MYKVSVEVHCLIFLQHTVDVEILRHTVEILRRTIVRFGKLLVQAVLNYQCLKIM